MYTVEALDKVITMTDCTYQEAKAALEQSFGDPIDAIHLIEKQRIHAENDPLKAWQEKNAARAGEAADAAGEAGDAAAKADTYQDLKDAARKLRDAAEKVKDAAKEKVDEWTTSSYGRQTGDEDAYGGSVYDGEDDIRREQTSEDRKEELKRKIRAAIEQGDLHKIRISRNGKILVEIPVNVGVVGGLIGLVAAPWALILGAVAAYGLDCSFELIRDDGSSEEV